MWLRPLSTPITPVPPRPAGRPSHRGSSPARPRSRASPSARRDALRRASSSTRSGMRQRDAPALARSGACPSVDPARLGPQLVVARGAVHEHDACGIASRVAAACARKPELRRAAAARSRARARRARASGRARGCAARCGSAWSTSQRAGASWLEPSVRLREAVAARRARARAISADLVRPCRSITAS